MIKFCIIFTVLCSLFISPSVAKEKYAILNIKEPQTLAFNTDSIKSKVKKAPFSETILSLNQKILRLEKEQKAALNKEKSLFEKLTEDLADNYREQKLVYFIELRDFLVKRGETLENIGKGIKKSVVD